MTNSNDKLDTTEEIDIVFDGPPSAESGRFVEVEMAGIQRSISVGEWIERPDGFWALRLIVPTETIRR